MRQDGVNRSSFLGRALLATGGIALANLAGSSDRVAAAQPSEEQDVRLLNFLLTLEYAQLALYEEAISADVLRGELRRFAGVARSHEAEHVKALRALLGADAEEKPTFRFTDATRTVARFNRSALTLEETAAAAYIGQAPNLTRDRVPRVAGIVAVEARHAAWIRAIVGRNPAPRAADPATTARQVARTLERNGFVKPS
ncbi:MAG TPA: ferritin-like domain-containing protein [Gaiellaceae bacterium]|jgi:hypothetical protein|nr:ferritin-like domain-containing protein [Gaiellaceae bacterium]